MESSFLIDGLITYLCFLPALTFHEFAHAWVAWKCGDDTARLQGRVSLNPIVHMDMLGTVILPLMAVFLGAAGSQLGRFIIGWGKPVPVNVYNLNQPRRDDLLVSVAGPVMNLLLAFGLIALAKVGLLMHAGWLAEVPIRIAIISLMLCFFNMLPVPPLDGSHVLKYVTGMSDEAYLRFSAYGFIILIVLINVPPVRWFLGTATYVTLGFMAAIFRLNA